MKISLFILMLSTTFLLFSQSDKKGTIKVEKKVSLPGLYLYESESGTKTYIKVFDNMTVMLANNDADVEYMEYWFEQMATSSNLPKGNFELKEKEIFIEIKVAQSKEDNILLSGTLIDNNTMKLQRIGAGYDNNFYLFLKQK